MKFSLENGKLEFNLENEWLEFKHYKTGILLGTKKFSTPNVGNKISLNFSYKNNLT